MMVVGSLNFHSLSLTIIFAVIGIVIVDHNWQNQSMRSRNYKQTWRALRWHLKFESRSCGLKILKPTKGCGEWATKTFCEILKAILVILPLAISIWVRFLAKLRTEETIIYYHPFVQTTKTIINYPVEFEYHQIT